MPGRDHTEGHRPATSLELLSDLVAVIAIAIAATSLHHSINESHIAAGVLSYIMIFWTIFWDGWVLLGSRLDSTPMMPIIASPLLPRWSDTLFWQRA